MSVPSDALAVMVEEREIRRLLATYCRGLDRFDVALWKSVWHPDATLDYRASGLRGTAHEMAEVMTLGHQPWASHSHQITSTSVVVKGARAVTETFIHAVLFGEADSSGLRTVDVGGGGPYLDRWSKRDGRWAVDHRYVPRARSGGMWKQTGEGSLGSRGRRDRSDPSYDLFGSLEAESGDPLALLVAEREIRQQLNTYCRAVDRRDGTLFASVWHPDGTLDYPDANLRGTAAELAEAFISGVGGAWTSRSHHANNMIIRIDGDRAVSETYASDVLRSHPDGSGRFTDDHSRGRYLDRWSRRDGRWAIDERLAITDFRWRRQGVEGRLGARSRDDRSDPSYDLFLAVG